MRRAGHLARIGDRIVVYGVWWGNLKGMRPFGRPRSSCEDNIKMYLQEVGWGAWTESMNLRICASSELL